MNPEQRRMRSREEIVGVYSGLAQGGLGPDMSAAITSQLVLEVLLDIRDLLQKPVENNEAHQRQYVETLVAGTPPEKDELFERAKEVAQKVYGSGSSITARGLAQTMTISYGRASSLIDQLEAAGVISAPGPITHRRKVI